MFLLIKRLPKQNPALQYSGVGLCVLLGSSASATEPGRLQPIRRGKRPATGSGNLAGAPEVYPVNLPAAATPRAASRAAAIHSSEADYRRSVAPSFCANPRERQRDGAIRTRKICLAAALPIVRLSGDERPNNKRGNSGGKA